MINQLIAPPCPSSALVVDRVMGPEHDDELVSETAIRAAACAFDEGYHHGHDELLAALRAASPVLRVHEHRVLQDRIQREIRLSPSPEKANGLRLALDILHSREIDLTVPR